VAHILFIHPGPVPPSDDDRKVLVNHLSAHHFGHVLQAVWGRPGQNRLRQEAGQFRLHYTFPHMVHQPFRKVRTLLFFLWAGWQLHRSHEQGFDVIVSYGWNTTGIAAVILKWLTGAKLIVEAPGVPVAGQRYQSRDWTWPKRLRAALNGWMLCRVLGHSDGVKLLYPEQVDGFLPKAEIPTSVFHDLVPIDSLSPADRHEKTILLLGCPWYLKGVDVLIKAFKLIRDEFPEQRLRVIGHCDDRAPFDELRAGDLRIEFMRGVPHEEAMHHMARCTVFVLPSRTEGMGRVLLEAMALRRPIIASRVDGIPHYIEDGENGLLFESESVDDLARQLHRVLSDRGLARKLADEGYERVHERYSEREYARHFDALIESVLGEAASAGAEMGDRRPDCQMTASS